jgi:hypothetical protein
LESSRCSCSLCSSQEASAGNSVDVRRRSSVRDWRLPS